MPRTRGTDYHTRYVRDHRIHRLVLRGECNAWNQIVVSQPEIDLLGNEGYVVTCERLVLNFDETPDPSFDYQQWLQLETTGLTTGRIVVNDNYFAETTANGQRVYKYDGYFDGASGSYADWYMRAVHNAEDDVRFLFEPTGPTQEYVVPHDRMNFDFKWRVNHRILKPPTTQGGRPTLAKPGVDQIPRMWAEVTYLFYPNRNRVFA